MIKSKFYDIEDTNITLKNCPPKAKIKVYYEVKDKRGRLVKKPKKSRYTLNQVGNKVDQLSMTVDKLAKIVNDGFERIDARIGSLEKDVKNINTRLDYIIKANDLKDLPNRGK